MKKTARLRALDSQIDRLKGRMEQLDRTSYRYSWVRIAAFCAGPPVIGLAIFAAGAWIAALCAILWLLLFGVSVYAHRRVKRGIERHRLWLDIKSAQVARARLAWDQIPSTFHYKPDPEHPFEVDLDLTGERSLHHLLDTAVSYEGSQRLRSWLTAPIPDPGQSIRRQQVVRELTPLHLFRDKMVLNAMEAAGARRTWKANQLVEWLQTSDASSAARRWLVLFGAWVALNAVLLAANLLGWLPSWWQITLAAYLGLWLLWSRNMEAAADQATALEGALRQLLAVFAQLETFSYRDTPHLRALCEPYLDPAHRPSRYLSRITRVVAAMGLRENPLLRLILNALLPWDVYLAYRLNQTRVDLGDRGLAWMDVWFELEALASLANFGYLNPAYSFPDLIVGVGQGSAESFDARGLGHPLIPDKDKVCNDFRVSELGQVTIITGSNMAGKSVFLKTVGLNLSLACAGGPVNAWSLRTVPFRLFASMGISDSVTDGISFFYAEVQRLKALLAELERDHALPLLFCIDEIFRGTNNRERLIGSRAYVRALAGKHGLGFIATHDLELAKLADELPQVLNYHFRDQVVDGRMAFDYLLLPGPSPTT
ncbi:MAG: hypothetical protein GWN58_18360, partial [Anaerolineae bacterium]|nr:hypothetical protein [Anaerolineae bacterium]